MPADTTVKYFYSEMVGAPVLSGTAGTLLDVLNACLVNGFGLKTADSLSVAAGVATMAISTGHVFETGTVVLVAGATPTELNGEKRVLSHTATSLTFDATGVADGTATGTITGKLAPAGWSLAHSGTNLAAYRSADVTSTQLYLRIDDTAARVARVSGYETMADINSGSGQFPQAGQVAGGLYWSKSDATSGAARPWIVVADARSLHVLTAYHNAHPASYSAYFFGDFISRRSGDAYRCAIYGNTTDQSSNSTPGASSGNTAFSGDGAGRYIARDYLGVSQSLQSRNFTGIDGMATFSGSGSLPPYPSAVDGGINLARMHLREGPDTTSNFRGELPGWLTCGNNMSTIHFLSKSKLSAEQGLAGRSLLAVQYAGSGTQRYFLDVTGPWQ